jgi:hypothetical protein
MAIALNIIVDNITDVMQIYNRVEIERADDELFTVNNFMLTDLGSPNGNLSYITLLPGTTYYRAYDSTGQANLHWYHSRYYNSSVSGSVSGWSPAVQGAAPDLFYDPCFPPEMNLTDTEKDLIAEIRLLVGDPLDVNREYGDEAASSIHPDGKTYELDEKGWPICITMNGVQYNDSTNPTINGYKYLIFDNFIDTTRIVCSGTKAIEYGVDIWYYTFRWSDRQIIEAYNKCPVPPGLTVATANTQSYLLYTALRLLGAENWHDAIEDGAEIRDEGTTYNPNPGFTFRAKLLDDAKKRLDDLIKMLKMTGITGVRVD